MPLVTTAHSSVIEQPPFTLGSQELLEQRLSAQHKSVDIDPSLVDTFGRKHRYLRLSLTDKCNLRCSYCSPEEGEEPLVPAANGEALTADEISRLLRLFVTLGVRKVRLTGGEPTIRGDFGRIVKDLGELRKITEEPLSLASRPMACD